MMRYSDLLMALGLNEKVDIEQVVRSGSCLVRMEQPGGTALELTLECDEERQVVWLYTPLGGIREEARAQTYGMLLRMHLFGLATGGAYFGFDAQRQQLNFFKTIGLASATAPDAARQVKAFVNDAAAMLQTLPTDRQAGSSAPGGGMSHLQTV